MFDMFTIMEKGSDTPPRVIPSPMRCKRFRTARGVITKSSAVPRNDWFEDQVVDPQRRFRLRSRDRPQNRLGFYSPDRAISGKPL